MIGPIAIHVHLINQGIPSPMVADFSGFIGFVTILVMFVYFGALACAKIARSTK